MRRFIFILISVLLLAGCERDAEPHIPAVSQGEYEEPAPPKIVKLVAVGDNLIHNTVYSSALKYGNGEKYNFLPIYEHVREFIKTADLAYINQETALGGKELTLSSYPLFNSPQEIADDMVELGFDIVSHANNHILDKGEKGVRNTIDCWRDKPEITLVGIYDSYADRENIRIVERNGIKFSVLAYTYGTNGLSLPKNSEYVVPYFDEELMGREIARAKELSDFVIVVMHWGNEDQFTPSDNQRYWAGKVVEAGADVILGGHPHVIQPIEYVDGALVIYSLGNFISSQNKAINMLGGMVSMEFNMDGDNKFISNVEFIPTITHYSPGYSGSMIYPLSMYTEELVKTHGILQRDKKFSLDYMQRLVAQTIDSKYLEQSN